ncbi:uncharacterized protein LOC103374035 isoform X2 [Stegastes partitus]|uniref:Uncharacterized protein LOC103374035 isoform X2 n=1 Tax=Stegastes partitus TaxID=144197 RepID=A0A9Y4NRN8_9TELE|nr:PREDICTED: uncharacterized protein LOC103374035 isoform X2 [Stegastes partitus]
MFSFTWIQISLFLMLLLYLTAVTGKEFHITVRDGDQASLPCENMINDQEKCDSTTWIYGVSQNSTAVELVTLGQIGKNAKHKSDRLSVSANCSLVIKKVTAEDVGRYTCRQYESGQQQGPDALVYLSLITVSGHKSPKTVMLSCFVLTYGDCRHTVKWLHQGSDVDKDGQDMRTSQSGCSATISFKTSYYQEKPGYLATFRCEVTNKNNQEVQLCSFTPLSSCEKAGVDPTKTSVELITTASPTLSSTTQEAHTDCSLLNYVMLAMRVAELLLITVITVVLVRARGNKRPPDAIIVLNSVGSPPVTLSAPAAHQVQDEAAVNYENLRGPFASVKLH